MKTKGKYTNKVSKGENMDVACLNDPSPVFGKAISLKSQRQFSRNKNSTNRTEKYSGGS